MTVMQRTLRNNLRTVLTDRGWKYRHLADIVGLPVTHIGNRMNAQWWSRPEIEAIAEQVDLSVDELLGDSVFREDVPAPAKKPKSIPKSKSHALCCSCGSMRLVSSKASDGEITVYDTAEARGRMLGEYQCDTCGRFTEHAVLRRDKAKDMAERDQNRPPADHEESIELARLWERIEAFGVDIRHINPRPKAAFERGWGTCLRVEYDESKSQWRIEIARTFPGLVLPLLKKVWAAVATEGVDADYWGDWDVTQGIAYGAGDATYSDAVDGLLDDIKRAAPVERLKLVQDVMADNEVSP